MSELIETKTYLIVTALGNIALRRHLVSDYSVEDMVRSRAISQARLVQMMNVGNNLDGNPTLPAEALPTVFQESEELSG